MTIKEALKSGLTAVRKPYWNETAYLTLQQLGDGRYGPWSKLHDVGTVTEILTVQADDGCNDWQEAHNAPDQRPGE